MAFDGVLLKALSEELNRVLASSRLSRIQETEKDEVLLTFKSASGSFRVLLSANPSLPLAALSVEAKESLPEAPNFCMVLRKHLLNGRLVRVFTLGLERVLVFEIEHLNEMGDLSRPKLLLELMGKHSNLILVNEKDEILDAVCHVTPAMSSVRTVLPGKPWFLPKVQDKADLLTETEEGFLSRLRPEDTVLSALSDRYTGISAATASEFLFRAGLDASVRLVTLSDEDRKRLLNAFSALKSMILENGYRFEIAYRGTLPIEFAATELSSYRSDSGSYRVDSFDSPSQMILEYYGRRSAETRIRERSADLRKLLKTVTERAARKRDLQKKELKDTESREKNRLFGELLSAYAYSLPNGEKTVTVPDYNDGDRPVTIPLDPALTVQENARRYFERYQKQKRTFEAATQQLRETEEDLSELAALSFSLDLAENEADLQEIREEMSRNGFLRRAAKKKDRKPLRSKPYHYVSSDGFHIYVGKNNLQNEELTFRLANGNDLFFHATKVPGSHVILKTEGRDVPDRAYEEAAALAAYYSTVSESPLVEVDYVRKKEVKKVPGAKPGFVVYDTHYSMQVRPSRGECRLLEEKS